MAERNIYYDGTKLLSMKDVNGNTPEVFMCTTNRSAGKTTFFNRMEVNRWLKQGKKFALLYRFNYELDDCADKFFGDIKSLFFQDKNMTSKRMASGIYHNLYIDEKNCGYAISMNSADMIKKYSHMFSDVDSILFDEFQSETNHYCDRELTKFFSIHTSIARGGGKQSRYVPVYMLSNFVTLLNPYYTQLGIGSRLQENTMFLRGNGWVLESGFNESAATAQKESLFNQAFGNNTYFNYITEKAYLNDSYSFIEKIDGIGRYAATLKFENEYYSIREYPEKGIIYCDDKYDPTFPRKIALTTEDHQINYVMLKNNDMFISSLRSLFSKGCFRFKNLKCKDVIIKALSF